MGAQDFEVAVSIV